MFAISPENYSRGLGPGRSGVPQVEIRFLHAVYNDLRMEPSHAKLSATGYRVDIIAS